MATAVSGSKALKTYLEMIKFEHSIFALPFAMIGMIWASTSSGNSGWPGWQIFGLITLCMITARSAAMAFNRIADRDIDAINPRTKIRAIPAGLLQLKQVNIFFYASCILFFAGAALLNTLTLILSPLALFIILFYSRTKRFTPLCHFALGISLGIAPVAAWAATTASLEWVVLPVGLGVMFWTAGFDMIYSLQDEEFDKENGLRSLPETYGKAKALLISRISHVCAIVAFSLAAFLMGSGRFTWFGIVFAAALLIYEQSLVKPDDLSKVNMAFFTLNGFVSIGFFVFVLLDLIF